jgi:hypothetical protein
LGQAYAGKGDNQEALKCYLQVRTIRDSSDSSTVKSIEEEISRLEKITKKSEPSTSKVEEPPAKPVLKPTASTTPEESKTEPPKKEETSTEASVPVQLLGGFIGTSTLAFLTSKFLFNK